VPSASPAPPHLKRAAPGATRSPDASVEESFPPRAFSAPFANVAAQGDGAWIAMKEPGMVKSVVHPDPKRAFAAVAVVAIDLRKIDLHMVAGTSRAQLDGGALRAAAWAHPQGRGEALIAAFNGGFKTTHGHYGMMLEGETFVPPRDISCTVGLYRDGSIKIRTWPELKDSEPTDDRLPADAALPRRAGQDEHRARSRRVQSQLGRGGRRRDGDPQERASASTRPRTRCFTASATR
jgi:hypothetical protein